MILLPSSPMEPRGLAHLLGHVLGLPSVPQPSQLLAPDGLGSELTPHEIEKARAHAYTLVEQCAG